MSKITQALSQIIFCSRWLQAPLYFGLIVALGLYVYEFSIGISSLVHNIANLSETQVMMGVLDLIDVVMIANLLIMVIVGGYDIFICRLQLKHQEDQPEWLDKLNAGTMKVKLALALVSISSIHLLRSFFDIDKIGRPALVGQIAIHLTLLFSVLIIAYTNKIVDGPHELRAKH